MGVLKITGAHPGESSIATTDILRARERVRRGRVGGREEAAAAPLFSNESNPLISPSISSYFPG